MQTQQEKYERKHIKRLAGRWCALVASVAALYFLNLWLVKNNATVTDRSITFLTVVLVFVTYMQWDVTAAQNDAIEKQLDQMELQQRAWLAVSAAPIPPFVVPEGENFLDVPWTVIVRNTGTTPGVVTHNQIEPKFRSIDEEIPQLKLIELRARSHQPTRTVVAPGAEIVFGLSKLAAFQSVSNVNAAAVCDGTKEGYLLCAFIYQDAFDKEHKTTCTFKYDVSTRQLSNTNQDGEMT